MRDAAYRTETNLVMRGFLLGSPRRDPMHASFRNNNNNIAVDGYGPRTETGEEPEGDEGKLVRVW